MNREDVDRVNSLLSLSWRVVKANLDEDQLDVWEGLISDGVIKKSSLVEPANEDVVIRLLLYPILRGVARVISLKNPYPMDYKLRGSVSLLGKEKISKITSLSGCSVKRERWMTFISPFEQATEMFINYLIPSFVMTTMRGYSVMDFPKLLDILRRSIDQPDNEEIERQAKEIKDTTLLIIKSFDARVGLYQRAAGIFNYLLSSRGERSLSTVIVLGPTPQSVPALSGGSVPSKEVLYRIASRLGLQEEDPVMYKLLGPESHVATIVYDDNGWLRYEKLGV